MALIWRPGASGVAWSKSRTALHWCYKSIQRSRAAEILAEAAQRELCRWLAIDDHPSVLKARRDGDGRFISCSPQTGINDVSAQKELKRKLAAQKLAALRT